MAGVEAGPVVLLNDRGERGLESAGRAGQVHREVGAAERRAPDGGVERRRDAQRRDLHQELEAGAHGLVQRLALGRGRELKARERIGECDIHAGHGARLADGAAGVQVDALLADPSPAKVRVDGRPSDIARKDLDRGAQVVADGGPGVDDRACAPARGPEHEAETVGGDVDGREGLTGRKLAGDPIVRDRLDAIVHDLLADDPRGEVAEWCV